MRAAVARDGELVVEDLADPVPGPGDALVAVRACGICGSDLHALAHAHSIGEMAAASGVPTRFDPGRDYVMGHEFCVEVLELGPATDGAPVRPGDLACSLPVALTPTGVEAIGYSNERAGGYGDRMLLTAAMCTPVRNGLDHRRAALTEPMAVGRHAVARAAVTPGDAAVVLGCGPVGLACILDLRRRGVETVVAADFSSRRRALAARIGATEVVDPGQEPPVDAWRRVDGRSPLVVVEAVGVPGVLAAAIRDAPPRSRVLVVGVCMEEDRIRPMLGVVKELDVRFAFGYDPVEFTETLRSIEEGELDVAPLVTGVVGVDGVPAAFRTLARPDDHVKILVEPGGPPTPEAVAIDGG